jgi:hypothetical protein
MKRCFPWGSKWTAYCGRESWTLTPVFHTSLIRCTRTKQCPCRNSFTVRWCTTSLLQSFSCLCGHGVSWSLDRKRGPIPDLTPLNFFFWEFVKDIVYRENLQDVNGLHDTESSELQSALPMNCFPVPGQKLCILKFPDWPPGARTASSTGYSSLPCSCITILWVSQWVLPP